MKDLAKGIVYSGIFAIPFIVLLISNSMFFPFITGKNFTFRILVEIIFAAWIILAFYDAAYRPKFSWILVSFAALLGVMFVANILGENPQQSFWSNFERMEGYVTLAHTFAYMLVLGTVFKTEKIWDRYFNTILGVAVLLSLYAFAQLSGNIAINQGGVRLDGTLGNSSYMAIYTLFLIFIALFMLIRTKSVHAKYVYGGLILLFLYLLIQTATRGTIIGLVLGLFIMGTYIALFTKSHPQVRKYAAGSIVAVIAVVGLFITFKDSSVIQNHPQLSRIASISVKEGLNRFNIWSMAMEGVKERPILGWGQGNYNYVFNKYYRPELHGQEAWFDRVHNILIDWLIAGGVLGAIAYFSILFSAIYYLFFRPLFKKGDETFTVVERGLLIGLLAGYTIHNVFVFDNIVSYIFYGTILAYIHVRVATPIKRIEQVKVHATLIQQVVAPVVTVTFVVIVYMVNIPGILAAQDIIDAFRTQNADVMLSSFDRALSRGSFGNQEIREQMTQRVQIILRDENATPEQKQRAFKKVEDELLKQVKEKPNDARIHVFIASFYRMTNNLDFAAEHLEIARKLSPNKQLIIFEQGYTALQQQNFPKALEYFKQAFDLGPQFPESRMNYAAAALYNEQYELARSLIETDQDWREFALSDSVLQAANATKQYSLMVELLTRRIEIKPEDTQARTSLAYVYNEMGSTTAAIKVLEQAGKDIPSFKEQADGFIKSLEPALLKQLNTAVGGKVPVTQGPKVAP